MKNNYSFRKSFFIVALVIAFIYLLIIRFFGTFTLSFPFTYDIGRDLLAARNIATFKEFSLIGQTTGLEGLFYGPSWHYFLAILYHPLMGNPVLINGFIVLTGVVVVILCFLLGKTIGGIPLGLVWAGLIAFSQATIELSSQIWSPNLIPVLWIVSFVFLYQIFIDKRTGLSFFLLGVVCSLIIDMEIVVGLLYAVGLGLGIIIFKRKVLSIKHIILGILGFTLILIPRIIFDLRHDFLLTKSLIGGLSNMIFENSLSGESTSLISKINAVFNYWSYTISLDSKIIGVIILIFCIISIIILFKKGSEKIKFFLGITTVSIFTTIGGIIFMGHSIWNHYLVLLPFLYITWISLIFALGFSQKKFKIYFIVFFSFLIFINMDIPKWVQEINGSLWKGGPAVYRNQINVIDYIYQQAGEEKFKYVVYTPTIHDYTYRYLFEWYGHKTYGKLPDEKDSELLFIVIEPDYEKPARLRGWLEIRRPDGKKIKQVSLDGDIVVQTKEIN